MMDLSHLAWRFFADWHRRFASGLAQWAERNIRATEVQKIIVARELLKARATMRRDVQAAI